MSEFVAVGGGGWVESVGVVLRGLFLGFQDLDILVIVECLLLVLLALLTQALSLAVGAYCAICIALRRVQVMTDYGRAGPDDNSIRIVN